MDETYTAKLDFETLIGRLSSLVAVLAIFISFLALFGLVVFVAALIAVFITVLNINFETIKAAIVSPSKVQKQNNCLLNAKRLQIVRFEGVFAFIKHLLIH